MRIFNWKKYNETKINKNPVQWQYFYFFVFFVVGKSNFFFFTCEKNHKSPQYVVIMYICQNVPHMKTSLPCNFCTKAKWTRQEVLCSCTDHCVQQKHASTHMQRKRTKKPDIHICCLKLWLDWLQQKQIFLKVWWNSPWTFGCLNCAVSSSSSI